MRVPEDWDRPATTGSYYPPLRFLDTAEKTAAAGLVNGLSHTGGGVAAVDYEVGSSGVKVPNCGSGAFGSGAFGGGAFGGSSFGGSCGSTDGSAGRAGAFGAGTSCGGASQQPAAGHTLDTGGRSGSTPVSGSFTVLQRNASSAGAGSGSSQFFMGGASASSRPHGLHEHFAPEDTCAGHVQGNVDARSGFGTAGGAFGSAPVSAPRSSERPSAFDEREGGHACSAPLANGSRPHASYGAFDGPAYNGRGGPDGKQDGAHHSAFDCPPGGGSCNGRGSLEDSQRDPTGPSYGAFDRPTGGSSFNGKNDLGGSRREPTGPSYGAFDDRPTGGSSFDGRSCADDQRLELARPTYGGFDGPVGGSSFSGRSGFGDSRGEPMVPSCSAFDRPMGGSSFDRRSAPDEPRRELTGSSYSAFDRPMGDNPFNGGPSIDERKREPLGPSYGAFDRPTGDSSFNGLGSLDDRRHEPMAPSYGFLDRDDGGALRRDRDPMAFSNTFGSSAGSTALDSRGTQDRSVEAKFVAGSSTVAGGEGRAGGASPGQEVEVRGTGTVPGRWSCWEDVEFPPRVRSPLISAGFPAPSMIQQYAWPICQLGRDLIGIAKTGSGKTLAFLLPAFARLVRSHADPRGPPAILVLAPTRELACQIEQEAKRFGEMAGMRASCLYGGAPKGPQLAELRGRPQVLVATPGRLNDLLDPPAGLSVAVDIKGIQYLVLDEADRMLDMGFEPQIRKIIRGLPQERQTLMFTATWPATVRRLASEFMRDAVEVRVGEADELRVNPDVEQCVIICSDSREKEERLASIIREAGEDQAIVFVNTKRMCESVALRVDNSVVIHGDKDQRERDQALGLFKSGSRRVLVATDVAARGLDIKSVRLVINFDPPNREEDYVHRVGRTGRAGLKGRAITLLTNDDGGAARSIVEIFKRMELPVPEELERRLASGEMRQGVGRGGRDGPRRLGGPPRRGLGGGDLGMTDDFDFDGMGGGRVSGGFGGGRRDNDLPSFCFNDCPT